MRAAIASALHRLAEAIDRSEPSRPPGSEQHPAGRATVPAGYAQGRADLQLVHGLSWRDRAIAPQRGHGASEGDPSL
jgi:hypothetical protein